MKHFLSKYDQIRGFGHIYLKKSLMKNFIFCAGLVCPESLYQAVLYLKGNNPFYHDISINMNDIPNELTDLTELDDNLPETNNLSEQNHCVKSVQMRSFFWSEYRKIRTRKNSVFGL